MPFVGVFAIYSIIFDMKPLLLYFLKPKYNFFVCLIAFGVYLCLLQDGTYGTMYFNNTLNDWSKFDINRRTKYDASISSGLAVMACNRHLYRPNPKQKRQPLNLNISKYNNKGFSSQIIKNKI